MLCMKILSVSFMFVQHVKMSVISDTPDKVAGQRYLESIRAYFASCF